MDLNLDNRTFIVTGASRGLGHACAKALLAEGANVVISSRTPEGVQTALTELGERAAGLAVDNADPSAADQLVALARERFGACHGALISVGGPPGTSAMNTSDEQWREAFESVFLGATRIATTVAAAINGPGSIAFVLSTSVNQPISGLAISNGLRPGLAMVAKTLADELGPRGIRVNGLLPGRIDTDRVRELDSAREDAEGARQRSERVIPLRRYGTADEFGRTAAFLLSDGASYLTGVMLRVDGGMARSL